MSSMDGTNSKAIYAGSACCRLACTAALVFAVIAPAASAEDGLIPDPHKVVFPDQKVGTQSGLLNINWSNDSSADIKIKRIKTEGPNFNDFIIDKDASSCKVDNTVSTETSCTTSIKFSPVNNSGEKNANLILVDNENKEYSAELTGKATAATATASPAELDFGNVNPFDGSAQDYKKVTVENTGDAEMKVNEVYIAGPYANQFTINNNSNYCINATVDPGEACDIWLGFIPDSIGEKSAFLKINTDVLFGGGIAVEIKGRATWAITEISPEQIDFGKQKNKQSSVPVQVKIENLGNLSYGIEAVDLIGKDPSQFKIVVNECNDGETVEPNGECNVYVSFSPTVVGDEMQAFLQVSTDQGDNLKTLLTGSAWDIDQTITADPPLLPAPQTFPVPQTVNTPEAQCVKAKTDPKKLKKAKQAVAKAKKAIKKAMKLKRKARGKQAKEKAGSKLNKATRSLKKALKAYFRLNKKAELKDAEKAVKKANALLKKARGKVAKRKAKRNLSKAKKKHANLAAALKRQGCPAVQQDKFTGPFSQQTDQMLELLFQEAVAEKL